jgi:O-methyltransferase
MPSGVDRLKRAARVLLGRDGHKSIASEHIDMEVAFHKIWERCQSFTMTSMARGYALFKAAEYITRTGVNGELVECGVWKGGSAMVMAMAMRHFGDSSRTLHLFDTFAGMTSPGGFDRSAASGQLVFDRWNLNRRDDGENNWARVTVDEVKTNLALTGYPQDKIVLHVGDVAETLPSVSLPAIAMLRLDTDFYESTKIELDHLYPNVARGGFVIVDDYGHFLGARKAVDEYLKSTASVPFLHRLDYTGRLIQIP